MAFDPSSAKPASNFNPSTAVAVSNTTRTGGRGNNPRAKQAQRRSEKRQAELAALRAQAEQSGIPLARDIEEIGMAPELNQLSLDAFLASAGALFTFDDKEVGDILSNRLGAEIVQDVEGNYIAKMPSGDFFAVNKPSFSGQDAIKLAGALGVFTPAGSAQNITRQAIGGAVTQGAIEAGQTAIGGHVDPLDVAIAGGAAPAVAGIVGGLKQLRTKFRPQTQAAVNAGEPAKQSTPFFGQQSKATQRIREKLLENNGDNETAGLMLNAVNRVEKIPAAKTLLKQGARTGTFDEGILAWLQTSGAQDKQAFKRMLDTVEKGLKNRRSATLNRPGGIVGDTLLKRFKHVAKINRRAGEDVSAAAKSLQNVPVDISQARQNFVNKLAENGVKVNDDNTLSFGLSTFEDNVGSIKMINSLWKRINNPALARSGLTTHRLKKFIDSQVEFGTKSTSEPIVREAEQLAKALRGDINTSLRNASDDYAAANDVFSETIESLNAFKDIAGKRFDPESMNAGEYAGRLSRRIMSNAQSREPLIDSIYALEDVAKKYGGNFSDDITTQLAMVQELENTFQALVPQTSLKGQVGQSLEMAARGDKQGIVIDAAKKGLEKAQGLNDENLLKALKEFVNAIPE